MNSVHTKRNVVVDSEALFDRALAAFGLAYEMRTDPVIARSILEEMKLTDFTTEYAPLQQFLQNVVVSPQPLDSFFRNIKRGLTTNHPAIMEFVATALEASWLVPSPHVVYAVHVTYILEALTAGMANNHDFFVQVQDYLREKERALGLDTRTVFGAAKELFGTTQSVFKTLKVLSLDAGIIFLRLCRGTASAPITKKHVRELYRRGQLNYLEYKILLPTPKRHMAHILEALRVNIYEAGITEYKHGFRANALCAYEMCEDLEKNPPSANFPNVHVAPEGAGEPFYESLRSEKNRFLQMPFRQEWISLYGTWNMAFLVGNMDELDLLFPKLVIPSIVGAKSESVPGIRVVSLWLALTFYFFRVRAGKKHVPGPKNSRKMVKAWEKINKKYAVELAKRDAGETERVLRAHYRQAFARPLLRFLKLLVTF